MDTTPAERWEMIFNGCGITLQEVTRHLASGVMTEAALAAILSSQPTLEHVILVLALLRPESAVYRINDSAAD